VRKHLSPLYWGQELFCLALYGTWIETQVNIMSCCALLLKPSTLVSLD